MKEYTNTEKEAIGRILARIFGLRKNRETKQYFTTWGGKTDIGVFEVVRELGKQIEQGEFIKVR